jgi:DNA end-binding protein Ku
VAKLRSIFNGTITFGLTVVPVKVHSAIEDRGVHFHQVHAKDGARINQRRMCSKEDREVPYKEVAKGYEVRNGEYVLLTQDEINAAAGERSHLIEVEEFVRAAEIDPVFYDRGYYLGAGDDGQDAYRLLHDALAKSNRVGVARWVFHNREYLVAIRALNAVLVMHTMRFADELISAEDLDIAEPDRGPAPREIDMAGALVDSLLDAFDPGAFTDSYRERVLHLIELKGRGEEPDLTEEAPAAVGLDLSAALEASLAGAGKRSKSEKKKG